MVFPSRALHARERVTHRLLVLRATTARTAAFRPQGTGWMHSVDRWNVRS